ncbi:MAG TPA: DNA polymerase III subunit alpha [Acidimicrobiales bacterium]|nr:DNA polymerase III subunit alpha [Acidimicrobiales bacterium]
MTAPGAGSPGAGGTGSGRSFAHLHQHTEYSMLDGAARIKDVVAAAAADGQPALAITDHGNMYGVLDFYKECRARGVTPIIGTEAYMAANSRTERPVRRGRLDDTGGEGERGEKLYYHLTLLAETTQGYRNLMKLSSAAYLEGYFYKPRCDWELLERYHEGLIATTGCLGGVVLQALLAGQFEEAMKLAGRLQDIFGPEHLFVELQDHGIADQHRTNPQLVEIARAIGAPLVATNDSHYCRREDAVAHDALLCVQTGATIDDPKRFKFQGEEHYLKSALEMRQLFAELPEACDNTLWIAERANVEIELGKPTLPQFAVPEEFRRATYEEAASAYLRHLTLEGAAERYGAPLRPEVAERIDYELGVIASMGFSAYFLVVWDLIHFARTSGIRVGPGRGSAAGCCVAYCLRIVDLDPIRYDLLFERFLNPGRKQMPDIDMDFDERYRGEMIRYATERYGWDRVAQIVTFSTIKARAAVRDAARVLGYPYALGDKIAKAMPPLVMGRDTPLSACLERVDGHEDGYVAAADLREMYEAEPDAKRVIDVAKGLEGLRRQDGIHAAAVVITHEPLTEYLPIQRKPEPGAPASDAPIVTQYEMHGVEELGLLKMDFLGLRNLSVIEMALDLIEEQSGSRIDIDNIALDDEKTFEMLRRAESIGVFQLEGGAMRATLRSLAPTSFDDVAALVALYRPGPMAANMHRDYPELKNGRKALTYLHPDLEGILGDTYGLMLYQESVMRVAQRFAGYSLEEADNLRKACLPAGSLMLTRNHGYVPIEHVMGLADRRVQTIDTTSASSRFAEVADVWPVGTKPVYRLTTSTGYSIEATAEHRFLVEEDWKELGAIAPGDLVAVAARTVTDGASKVTMAQVELAALLISEGDTPDLVNGPRQLPHFCNTDPELIGAFCSAFVEHFGYSPSRVQRVGGVTRVALTNHELLDLADCLGKLGLSADKTIPLRLINAPLTKVERFLGLYFCADGWADRSGAHFGSKSKDVCLGLKRMLLRTGILSNLHRRSVDGHGTHWTLSIADKGQAKAFARLVSPHLTGLKAARLDRWLVGWGERSSATNIGIPSSFLSKELARASRVTGKSKRRLGIDGGGWATTRVVHRDSLNGLLYSERLEDLRSGDLVWDAVASVEYVGDLPCFDFEMAQPERPYAVVEDFLVHNCGKKIRSLIAAEREKFVAGCVAEGYTEKLATELFDIIEPFADYAFNKSHSYGYGLVAYQTAWLKANHPVEYLAALLSSVKDDKDKTAVYLAECRNLGIEVHVPDVNLSSSNFTARHAAEAGTGGSIVFGLSAIRNVGEGLVAHIVAEREKNGPFADFHDFCCRVDPSVLNKRTVESLAKAGAFDSLGHPRKGLCLVFEDIIDGVLTRRREEELGISTLFSLLGDAAADQDGTGSAYDEARREIPDVEFDKAELLACEKEMLGLYVSDHPLLGMESALRRHTDGSIRDLIDQAAAAAAGTPAGYGEGGGVRVVGGVVTSLSRRYTRRGELMAQFVLEDLEAAIEVMVFPKAMAEYGIRLEEDAIVCVRGRLDSRDDQPKLLVHEITRPVLVADDANTPLEVSVPVNSLTESVVLRLRELVVEHPGSVPLYLRLGSKVLRLPAEFNVDPRGGFVGALKELLGANALAP